MKNYKAMSKLKISKTYAEEFDEKCAKHNAHGFLRYITEPDDKNISLLDLFKEIEKTIIWQQVEPESEINLNEKQFKAIISDFYETYFPYKAKEVKQILNRSHPYFIDRAGNCHINFIKAEKNDFRSSNVGHAGRRTYLEFNVYFHNNVDDLSTTAHEIAHAISSHHKHLIELIRSDTNQSEIDKYIQRKNNFDNDCIGEIESLIVEKLFIHYLHDMGLITEKDLCNFEKKQQATLLSEINLIQEEREILKELPCPVTEKSLANLVKNLEKTKNKRLIERIEKMHDNDRHSSYMFRYIVGRIVSEEWMKKYLASGKQKQTKMLEQFEHYLDNTYKLNLNNACDELLNLDFTSIVENYVIDKLNQRKAKQQKKSDKLDNNENAEEERHII